MAKQKHEQTETAVVAPVATTPAPATVKKEQTSEKLEQLKKEHVELQKHAGTLEAGSDERNDADIASYKKAQEIKAEKQNIIVSEQAALLAEKRNARVKLADNHEDQIIRAIFTDDNGKLDNAKCQEASVKVHKSEGAMAAREIVVNELLSKYSGGSVKTSTGAKAPTGTRGAVSQAIRALIVPMYAAGVSGSEVRRSMIKDHGYNDGTANGVIHAYEVENGLK